MGAVSIRLPNDVSTRLQDLAQLTGRSETFYMIEAIRKHLDELEDVYLGMAKPLYGGTHTNLRIRAGPQRFKEKTSRFK